VALLFGTEDDGLDTAALDRCHCVATLPTNPHYPALNLAQSVLLFLYELARCAGTTSDPPSPDGSALAAAEDAPVPATHALLEQLFTVGEEALEAIDFFKYNPQAVMRTLRQLAYRAEVQPQEAALLLAIARQAIYIAQRAAGGERR
jgi:tRNA C32,U32 (ribose-2'-O)-methylase TrmJ